MPKTVAGKVSEGVMMGGWEKKRYEKKEIIFFLKGLLICHVENLSEHLLTKRVLYSR